MSSDTKVMLRDSNGYNIQQQYFNPVADAYELQKGLNGASYFQTIGTNTQIHDGTAVWANSAAVNTPVNIDIALPTVLQGNANYLITVTNPSAVSALTVSVKNKETFGVAPGTARYPQVATFAVPANSPDGRSVVVQGWMLGEAGRLTISNDTVLGAADGFTAYVRARKIYLKY